MCERGSEREGSSEAGKEMRENEGRELIREEGGGKGGREGSMERGGDISSIMSQLWCVAFHTYLYWCLYQWMYMLH